VLLLDLDDFKAINDAYGHDAGDAVLKTQARRLAAHVDGRGVAGRLGGDELVAVLNPDAPGSGDVLAEDLRLLTAQLSRPVTVPDGITIEVRASVGAAVYTDLESPSLPRALSLADAMMYRCKQHGCRWRIAAPGQDPRVDPHPVRRRRHRGRSAVYPCTV